MEAEKLRLQTELYKTIKCKSKKGSKLLKAAARGNDKEIVRLLTNPKIDINVKVNHFFFKKNEKKRIVN